jgi:two-component system, NarL family, sensor histidine kinase UhpB
VRAETVGELLLRRRVLAPAGHAIPLEALPELRIAAGWTHERLGSLRARVVRCTGRDYERVEAALLRAALRFGPARSGPRTAVPGLPAAGRSSPGAPRSVGARSRTGAMGTNGVAKRAERPTSASHRGPTVRTVTEQVAQLETYRSGARALAARILNAQEQERVRVSRELHDDTGQALTLLLVRLQLVEGMSSEPDVRQELADLRELVGETLDGVRRLAVHLGPSVLEDLGLCAALEWLADRVRAETGLVVDLRLDCECDHVPPEVAVAVFRVAQEALTNVVRHARAARVEMRLETDGGSLDLTVADDGAGFSVEEAQARPTASIGLFGMAERTALVGGQLDMHSSPGAGTRVRVTVPLRVEVFA